MRAGRTLEAALDPHFGRCSTFMLVETDGMSIEAIDDDSSSRGGGAGIRTAQLIANQGVRVVLTGSCGPNAYRTLRAAGIDVIVGCSDMSRVDRPRAVTRPAVHCVAAEDHDPDVLVRDFLDGRLAAGANVCDH